MLKILVIQAANGLSDERAEILISDRLSFMRFLGLGPDRVPDARTIWLFRERLTKAGAIEPLFARFETLVQYRQCRANHLTASSQKGHAVLRNCGHGLRAPVLWQRLVDP